MPILEYGPPIDLESAKRTIEAAEAEAAAHGWAMAIAVVDSTGHLVALHRMDRTQHGSIAIAEAKARTAVDFKRPTKMFEDAVAAGGLGLRLLSARDLCPLEGGIPLLSEGRLVGAVGASGGQSTEDGQVAQAGARAFHG